MYYTQSVYNLTNSFTEIQIVHPFKYLFMKICSGGIETTDIDFSKSTLTMGDTTSLLERYNLVNSWAELDLIYDGLLYCEVLAPEPSTTLKFNLTTSGQGPYQLYVVTMDKPYHDMLYKERESGIRNIGSISWMCSDKHYLEVENRIRLLREIKN